MLSINQGRQGYPVTTNKMKQDEAKQNINNQSPISMAWYEVISCLCGSPRMGFCSSLLFKDSWGGRLHLSLCLLGHCSKGEGGFTKNTLALKGFCSSSIGQRNSGSWRSAILPCAWKVKNQEGAEPNTSIYEQPVTAQSSISASPSIPSIFPVSFLSSRQWFQTSFTVFSLWLCFILVLPQVYRFERDETGPRMVDAGIQHLQFLHL